MNKRPAIRNSFNSVEDELNYLGDFVSYYASLNRRNSRLQLYLYRYKNLLSKIGTDDGSLILQEHWATYFETIGEIANAVPHREREVELVKRVLDEVGPIGPIDDKYLEQRIAVLAGLYTSLGLVSKAEKLRWKNN